MRNSRKCFSNKSWLPISGIVIFFLLLVQPLSMAQSDDIVSKKIGTLKFVPGGAFGFIDENSNKIKVTSLYMSQSEITQAQYIAVTGATNPSYFKTATPTTKDPGLRPVEGVTWYDAVEFCNRLSILEGLAPVYTIADRVPLKGHPITSANVTMNISNNGYRLPTAAEWQWAAMGARDNQAKAFAGSTGRNAINDYVWYSPNSADLGLEHQDFGAHQVGTKRPNELGLYDMSGNVWEWCWDSKELPRPTGDQVDNSGESSPIGRVCRGGSWESNASAVSVVSQAVVKPNGRGNNFGFRVVRPISSLPNPSSESVTKYFQQLISDKWTVKQGSFAVSAHLFSPEVYVFQNYELWKEKEYIQPNMIAEAANYLKSANQNKDQIVLIVNVSLLGNLSGDSVSLTLPDNVSEFFFLINDQKKVARCTTIKYSDSLENNTINASHPTRIITATFNSLSEDEITNIFYNASELYFYFEAPEFENHAIKFDLPIAKNYENAPFIIQNLFYESGIWVR